MENLLTIFEDIQSSKRSHKSHAKKINGLVTSSGKDGVAQQLLNGILDQTLIFPKKTIQIQRILDFYSTLCALANEIWQNKILTHLYERLKCANKSVRERACHVLAGFMTIICQEELEIEQQIIDSFVDNIMIRLEDRIPAVRVAAIEALKHLQDPQNDDCKIIAQFVNLLDSDDTDSVRKTVAKTISLCEKSKHALVKHIRDIKPDIRISVINRFVADTDIRQFPKEMRIAIVEAGLNDRDVGVRSATEQLLLSWLALLNHDMSKFLIYFSPTEYEDTTKLVAAALAEKVMTETHENYDVLKFLSPKWSSSLASMSATDLLWVQVKCSFVAKFQSKFTLSQFCDKILPDAARYCTLLSTTYDNRMHMNFKHLLELAPFTNSVSDVRGTQLIRDKLADMMLNPDVDSGLMEPLLSALWKMSEHDRATCHPMDVLLGTVDDLRAQAALGDEPHVLNYRAALIVQWMIQNNHYDKIQMKNGVNLVVECLQQRLTDMRVVAVTSLSVLSVLDKEIREQYLPIIKRVALEDFEDISVRIQALQGLLDMCMIANEEFTVEDRLVIDSTIAKLMDHEDSELRTIAMEGSVKLIFSGFSKDPQIMSKLLQFFFIGEEQTGEIAPRLQQMLSVFLQTFLATGDSCLEVVRLSISLFISELTTAIRDEIIQPAGVGTVSDMSLQFRQ
jgi:hypothetical protein